MLFWFPAAIAIIAALYASVGQAGATGYIAVMGLLDFDPTTIKPTALALNILVAAIGSVRFFRASLMSWRTCYPFAVLGAPFSVIGGAVNLPARLYRPIVGAVLLVAAVQMIRSALLSRRLDERALVNDPPFLSALLAGGGIGFIAGVTGAGGGIFLAPLILLFGWVDVRRATAVSARLICSTLPPRSEALGRRSARFQPNFRGGCSRPASAGRSVHG